MATQSIPDFVQKSEQYGMHNARPDPIEFMWGGNRFELPGCDAFSANPVKLDDGTPIPGTLVVKDGYILDVNQMMPSGPPNWSAKEAIRAVLGIKSGGEATSKLAFNGVSYMPLGCTREEYERILAAGKTRYKESLIGWATDVVQNYEEARNKAKQAGVNSTPPGQDFYMAQAVLKEHERGLKEKFGLAEQAENLDDDLQFEVYAKAVAMKMAKGIAELEGVDQLKLMERMLEDPKISANIRKKYSLRKRGYMDPTEAPGAEQPDPVPGE